MHVVLGALGSVVTILWLLYRLAEMGIDLGGLNPFLWQRRRRWKNHHDANPIFKIDSPMEITALLMTAVAKADGDMSVEEKRGILRLFGEVFHLGEKDAAGLLISSSYLLAKGDELRGDLKRVMAPSLERFRAEQADSAIDLLRRVARLAGPPSDLQEALITAAAQQVLARASSTWTWH